MALPVRPSSGIPRPPLVKPSTALPEMSEISKAPAAPQPRRAPVLVSENKHQAHEPRPEAQRTREPRTPTAPVQPAPKPNTSQGSKKVADLPEGYALDPTTGKAYKKLGGYRPGVMHSSKAIIKAGGMTLDQLRLSVEVDPDFSLDDLNGSADTFLSHLRVPPNKEEQEKLRKERELRQRQYDRLAEDEAEAQAAADRREFGEDT